MVHATPSVFRGFRRKPNMFQTAEILLYMGHTSISGKSDSDFVMEI